MELTFFVRPQHQEAAETDQVGLVSDNLTEGIFEISDLGLCLGAGGLILIEHEEK